MEEGTPESMAIGLGVAGGAVLTILLDELLNKAVLTNGDIRGILQKAQNGVVAFYGSSVGREAGRAIADLLARFPEQNA
jgi:hypothetical protein